MREGKRAGKELISIQRCDEMRGVSIDEDENIRIGSLTSFYPHHTRPDHPAVYQRPRRGRGHGGRPADPQRRHHRRQHLQRRDLRRLRLHAPRVGGHRGAHGQKRRAPRPDQGLLHQGRHRGPARRGRRDPDGDPHPQGSPTTGHSGTTSSTPCETRWTSRRSAPPSTPA